MASATGSGGRKLLSLDALAARVERATQGAAVPLLVLRLPEFQETAWRDGTRAARALERSTAQAFRAAAREIVRASDALAHDRGSDRFVVAMLASSREGRRASAADCRVMLERLVVGIAGETGRRMESGWWALEHAGSASELEQAAARALERGARERERYEFLAAVGHELRTPLASIRGYLETLLDDEGDALQRRRFLETARREALRLARMVDGMLDFSLLDLSPPALHAAHCDVRERLAAAADVLAPLARRRATCLSLEAGSAARALIDGEACMHALLNLAENAIRYGGRTVRLSCFAEAESVIVLVDDDGPGFSEGIVRGHGLGLTIARTIAEHAGGEMCLDRSPLGGTRARLRLPAASEVP